MAGFENDIGFSKNFDFTQADNQAPVEANGLATNGQLWIGTTALNAGGTHINVGTLTSPDNSITFGYSSPNITAIVSSPPTPTPSPASVLNLVDDFIASQTLSQLIWAPLGSVVNANGTSTHPGLVQIVDGASSALVLTDPSFLSDSLVVGGGSLSVNFVVSLVTLSAVANRYIAYFGLGDAPTLGTSAAPAHGIYFSYSDNVNSGNWVLNCTSATVTTSINTAIPAVTGFVNLGLTVNAAGTSVSFTINGASAGAAIVSNIPSAAISPFMMWLRSSGALPASLIDLFYLTNTLTISR